MAVYLEKALSGNDLESGNLGWLLSFCEINVWKEMKMVIFNSVLKTFSSGQKAWNSGTFQNVGHQF